MSWSDRKDELEAQDAAEIAALAIPTSITELLTAHGLVVARQSDVSSFRRHDAIIERERKAADAAARTAARDAGVPYAGAIVRCQADVYSHDRSMTFYRCTKKGTLVVRRPERGAVHGDGRLVVCGTHARDTDSRRHTGMGGWHGNESAAIEVVESEYQP